MGEIQPFKKKLFVAILIVLTVILILGNIYTNIIVRRAEVKYPSAQFLTVENVKLHYLEAGTGQPVVIIPGGDHLFSERLDELGEALGAWGSRKPWEAA